MGRAKAVRAERRARGNIPRRRQDLVRHAARQSRLARRRRLARGSAAAAAPHHCRTTTSGWRSPTTARAPTSPWSSSTSARGTQRRDYDGKDVRGKLVLCDATPSACHRQAVEEHGAAGLVSYNSNQVSAWWRDDQDLIRWGHLDARGRSNTFAIMISVREARALQQRLAARRAHHAARGRPRAQRRCDRRTRRWSRRSPARDPAAGDIVFSCHLDHQKPGANDNASGCAANLEIARTLETLIDAKRIPPPSRTIRFIWPSEMTGTIAYLAKYPEIAGADSRRRPPRHGRRRSVHHQIGPARDALALVDRDGHRRRRRGVRTLRDRRRDAGGGRRRHDARHPLAAADRRTRSGRTSRRTKAAATTGSIRKAGSRIPVDLPARPPRRLHSHDRRRRRQHRADEDQAVGVHRGGERLLPGDDAGSGRGAAAAVATRTRTRGWPRTAAAAIAMAARHRHAPRDAANIVAQGVLREQRRLRSLSRSHASTVGPRRSAWRAWPTRARRSCRPSCRGRTVGSVGARRLPRAADDARVPVRNAAVKGPLAPAATGCRESGSGAARDRDRADAEQRRRHLRDRQFHRRHAIGQRDSRRRQRGVRAGRLAAVAEYIDLLAKAARSLSSDD